MAENLGLIDDADMTLLGAELAHPCRELLQWEDRARAMPLAEALPEIAAECFAGQQVLEVGSGFGVNLLSLDRFAKQSAGIEINAHFVALAAALAHVAGCQAPRVFCGRGEALPFDASTFDTVLNLGALQYMAIEEALLEMARVVRPGGLVVAVLGHLRGYLSDARARHWRRPRPRPLLREAREIATMVTYPSLSRTLGNVDSPVYPSRRRMAQWIAEAGLRLIETREAGRETAYLMRG